MSNIQETAQQRDRFLRALHEVMERDNSLSRTCAVQALERMDAADGETRGLLLSSLRDPDADVRAEAAQALGRMKATEATGPLLENITQDPDGGVRIQAVGAVAKIGSADAVEPLIRCMREDGFPELGYESDDQEYNAAWEVQSRAMEALGEIRDQRATEAVIELLENDEYDDLQEAGFRVLARLSDDESRAFLLRQLRQGSYLARRRAAQAMRALHESAGERSELPLDFLQGLSEALLDKDSSVRLYAAQALSGSANPLVIAPLTMLLGDPDPEVRMGAVEILGSMRGREILDRLYPLLKEKDLGLRKVVVRILGEIGESASVSRLNALLGTADEKLRYEVVQALGRIGSTGPETGLARLLGDGRLDSDMRAQAAQALGRILGGAEPETKDGNDPASKGDEGETSEAPRPEEILERTVYDPDRRVSFAALNALLEMDSERSVDRLMGLLLEDLGAQSDDAETVADGATEEDSGTPEETAEENGVEELKRAGLLVDGDPGNSTLASILAASAEAQATMTQAESGPAETENEPPRPVLSGPVRVFAARLLGGVPEPGQGAMDALIEVCESGDDELRLEALRALARIGDEKALPQALRSLAAERPLERLAAVDILGRFPDAPRVAEALNELIKDPDRVVRHRIVQSLASRKDGSAAELLLLALEDEDQVVCRTALASLSEFDCGADCGERIANLMFRFGGELRKEAGACLRRLNDLSATSRLLATLDDPEREEFHWICIDAMGEMYARQAGVAA